MHDLLDKNSAGKLCTILSTYGNILSCKAILLSKLWHTQKVAQSHVHSVN